MDPMQLSKQVFDFNKRAFSSTYTAMCMMQDQTMKAIDSMLTQSPLCSVEVKSGLASWIAACNQGRDKFKAAIDEQFNMFEKMLNGQPAEKTKK